MGCPFIYHEIVQEDWFKLIIKHKDSCVKDNHDALSREFFRGVYRFTKEDIPVLTEICPPALNEKTIKERLKDTRFCNKCFYYKVERHDWNCDDSPWNKKHF